MDTNANAPMKYKYLSIVCVHYGQPASTPTKDVKSMRTGCFSIFNLTKRGVVLVPTNSYMAYNHEVNGEEMEQANVMLADRKNA